MADRDRPSILFLCHNLPHPPDTGARIRSFHTLKLLGQRFDVTALCFFRRAGRTREDVQGGIRHLEEYAVQVEAYPIPQDGRPMRFLLDHARSVIGGRAYTRWTYDSSAVRRRLRSLLRSEAFALVHLDSLDLVAYGPLLRHLPFVCAHHNVESSLLARRAELADGWRRRYLEFQSRRLASEEQTWCPRARLNVVVSAPDAARLASRSPEAEIMVMPNGVDTGEFVPGSGAVGRGVVFVGGYTWFPNRDGMQYFVDAILPGIRARNPDVEVTWVGSAPTEVRDRFGTMGVTMTGHVEDIRPAVNRASCVVVPLRLGGGTRLKILDAWALGKAVVSTSVGCEGLAAEDGVNILIADDPRDFANAVSRVIEDPDLRRRIEAAGRSTAVRSYDWTVVGDQMVRRYEEIANPGRRVGR